jgi:type I restriction enzyme S subunit
LTERRAKWEAGQLAKLTAKGTPPKDDKWKAKLSELIVSELIETEDLPAGWIWSTLAMHGEVISGVTKGRKLQGAITHVHYLRVANVQAGFFDLREVKTIEALDQEIADYALRAGDVLFTEGGDRDKLGRGCVWQEAVPGCIFQNHIHRARLTSDAINPWYVSSCSNAQSARDYFMSVAKQTVNLASLNSTNLKKWPVPLTSMIEQREIVARVEALFEEADGTEATAATALANLRRLEQSTLQAAFRGEL